MTLARLGAGSPVVLASPFSAAVAAAELLRLAGVGSGLPRMTVGVLPRTSTWADTKAVIFSSLVLCGFMLTALFKCAALERARAEGGRCLHGVADRVEISVGELGPMRCRGDNVSSQRPRRGRVVIRHVCVGRRVVVVDWCGFFGRGFP